MKDRDDIDRFIEARDAPAGPGGWTFSDVQQILLDQFLAVEMGAPPIVSRAKMDKVRGKLMEELGFDPVLWAKEKAERIRAGLDPLPDLVVGP